MNVCCIFPREKRTQQQTTRPAAIAEEEDEQEDGGDEEEEEHEEEEEVVVEMEDWGRLTRPCYKEEVLQDSSHTTVRRTLE